MNKLFTLFFLFFSLSFFNVKAQVHPFEEAYIIQNIDTIHGYIKSSTDLELSKSISFKTELNAATTTEYKPADINGFYIKNSGFNYASVKVEIRKDTLKTQAERFAQQLLSGYTDLYKLPIPSEEQSIGLNRQNTNLYILKKENTYYTLGLYETITNNVLSSNKRYIGVIKAVFNDCNSYTDNLDHLGFDDKSIMKEVTKYNQCKNPSLQTLAHDYKPKSVIKHGLEVNYTQAYIPDNPDDYEGKGYSAGYYLDFILPAKSRKYLGKIGIGYMYYKSSRKDFFEKEKSSVGHIIRLPMAVQYNFRDAVNAEFSPYINAGITMLMPTTLKLSQSHPYLSFGIGMYHKRMRYTFLVENEGPKLNGDKLLNFSVGIRLNK